MAVFTCKEFTVRQDRSAWRVGTDSMLLGSWTDLTDCRRVLDVGTGTGFLALMVAQRMSSVIIDAVESHSGSLLDAADNFSASPWSDRLQLHAGRLQDLVSHFSANSFDLLISNPPYYVDGPLPPREERVQARYARDLSHRDLLQAAGQLLTDSGRLAVVLPVVEGELFIREATEAGFSLRRRCSVRGRTHKPVNRWLLELVRRPAASHAEETLVVYGPDGFSPDYRKLTYPFHTIF